MNELLKAERVAHGRPVIIHPLMSSGKDVLQTVYTEAGDGLFAVELS